LGDKVIRGCRNQALGVGKIGLLITFSLVHIMAQKFKISEID
jgi:hypothetical protein